MTATTVTPRHVLYSAHMVLNTPKPFTPNGNKVQNAPIDGGTALTEIVAGQNTLVNFSGSAIHGGGSCQFAISTSPSTNPADWRVFHTIIGGCPGTEERNLVNLAPQNPDPIRQSCTKPDAWDEKECVRSFNIPMPKEVPSSKYFFAWMWFNRLGNREMYMECAPTVVINGGSDPEFLNTLPSIFYANVAKQPCETEYGESLKIPNPGQSVIVSNGSLDNSDDNRLGIDCKNLFTDPVKGFNVPGNKGTPGFPPNKPAATMVPYTNLGNNPFPIAIVRLRTLRLEMNHLTRIPLL